jgi:phosphohistidine phosphatase SixA
MMKTSRRLPFLASLLVAAAMTACASPRATTSSPVATGTTTSAPFINVHALIIVRHGDIDIANKKSMGSDAPLTARGEQRARELAYALKDAGINRIVTSETLRTQETAAILAKNLSITLETPFSHGGTSPSAGTSPVAPADHPSKKKEAAAVIHYLAETAHPGDVLLLVHHHSVIPSLLDALGYKDEPPFAEGSEFDRIYVVLPDPATHTYRVLRLRYGGTWGNN